MVLGIIISLFLSFIIWVMYPDAKERKKRRVCKRINSQLKKNRDLNKKNEKGDAFIHSAIWYKDFELFTQLIDNNADINIRDKNGRTPLIYAALFNYHKMVKLLLEKGADANEKDFSGNTSLHWLGMNGGDESAKLLIEYGADVNALNEKNRLPIHSAMDFQKTSMITLFIKNGSDPNITSKREGSPLFVVGSSGDRDGVLTLIEHGAMMSIDEVNGCMSDLARFEHDGETLKIIADYATATYGKSDKLKFPLFYTVLNIPEIETAALLIEKGADVDATIAKIKDLYRIKIKISKNDSPYKIAKRIINPLRKAMDRKERKERLESFIDNLPKIFFISLHILFIAIPTIYLCFAQSWLYFLIPGIPLSLVGLMIYSLSSGPSATGDARGGGLVLIILAFDVFIMLLMTIIAIWRFNTV